MRVMLTGGSGMVGRNFLENEQTKNFEILAPSSEELNLFDVAAVQEYLQRTMPDIIIHAAGKVGGIQANIKAPTEFLLANLDMGRNLVVAAFKCGVKKILNLGSSCMYPHSAQNPLREEDILRGELEPTNEAYALAKVTIGRLCEYIGRENGEFAYKTLIPCNLYGRWDKFDPSCSHLIPAIIHKLHQAKVAGEEMVVIWGDGKARREFMYAGDLSDCLMRALLKFDDLPQYINVGKGFDYSVTEYYQAAAEIIGYRGEFIYDCSKPVGMRQKLVDVSRLRKWGWESNTELEAGLKMTYDYYLSQLKGERACKK